MILKREIACVSLPDINFENIRPHDGSRHAGFEELCSQLASLEPAPARAKFYRKGRGADAGVECYRRHADGTEVGWQAKYISPHREVVWVILADFDRCLLLLLPLWACGQRFFSVVHMSTAMTWGCRWFGRPDLMVVGRERAVRQFRNLAAL